MYKISKQLKLIAKQVENLNQQYLYHATYKALLRNIKKKGLGNTKRVFWEDSKPGVVYLANDPDIAESYAEANDEVNEQWLDEIIILKVKIKDLDQKKLFIDENVNGGSDTYEYHGIIPWNLLTIV